jgi:uncharacterized protein YjcR
VSEEIRAPVDKGKVKEDYINGMKYKDLAEKYCVSINTVKSWIKRYGWSEDKKTKGAPTAKKGAPLNNKNAVGHGAPKGSRNAAGKHKGNCGPPGNKNAEKFGFFSKYLPEDTVEIMQQVDTKSPVDMVWDMIILKYTAIIRAQKIMYVKDKDDITQVIKKKKSFEGEQSSSDEVEYEFQFAWDKQASFLQAQSRAMSELRGCIRQYEEMLKDDLATEEQKLRIEKIKVDIEKVKGKDKDESIQILVKRKEREDDGN